MVAAAQPLYAIDGSARAMQSLVHFVVCPKSVVASAGFSFLGWLSPEGVLHLHAVYNLAKFQLQKT